MTKEQMEQLLALLAKELEIVNGCIRNYMEECGCDDSFVTTPNDSDERAFLKRIGRKFVEDRDAISAALTQHGLTGMIYVEEG